MNSVNHIEKDSHPSIKIGNVSLFIPNEILLQIFKDMDWSKRLNVSLACKLWRILALDLCKSPIRKFYGRLPPYIGSSSHQTKQTEEVFNYFKDLFKLNHSLLELMPLPKKCRDVVVKSSGQISAAAYNKNEEEGYLRIRKVLNDNSIKTSKHPLHGIFTGQLVITDRKVCCSITKSKSFFKPFEHGIFYYEVETKFCYKLAGRWKNTAKNKRTISILTAGKGTLISSRGDGRILIYKDLNSGGFARPFIISSNFKRVDLISSSGSYLAVARSSKLSRSSKLYRTESKTKLLRKRIVEIWNIEKKSLVYSSPLKIKPQALYLKIMKEEAIFAVSLKKNRTFFLSSSEETNSNQC